MNRRLPALFLGLVLLAQVLFFSGFSGVFAQAAGNVLNQTKQIYFQRIIEDVTRKRSLTTSTQGELKTTYTEVISLISGASDVFESSFRNLSPSDAISTTNAYVQGLANALSFAETNQSSKPRLQTPEAVKILDPWKNLLSVEITTAGRVVAGINGVVPPNASNAALSGAQATARPQVGADDPTKCGLFGWSVASCANAFFVWFIKTFLLSLVSIFTWLFGMLFHYSVYYGVLRFSSLVEFAALLPIWQTIRDIFNLVMIFFGFGLAILYILNLKDDLKKFIPWLVVYALFVNFSWTVSKTLVDYSNVLTLKMYQVTIPNVLDENANSPGSEPLAATQIMNSVGLQTLIQDVGKVGNSNTSQTEASSLTKAITSAPAALLLVVMAGYLAYVFLIAAIIFMLRSALLILFIIFSPILLIDVAVPWVGEYAKKGREIFFSQLMVGFVFMLFFFVVVQTTTVISTALKINQSGTNASTALASGIGTGNSSGAITSFFSMFIVLVLLYIMMKAVRAISPMAGQIANAAAGAALGVATGGTAFAARATLGAGAARFANSAMLDRMQGSRFGRGLKATTNRVANGTMDLRNLDSVQSIAGKAGIAKSLGKSTSQGAQKNFEQKAKNVADTAAGIRDKTARNKYLAQQQAGAFGVRGAIDKKLEGTKLDGFRSDRALIADKITTDQYKTAKGKDKAEVFDQATSTVKKQLLDSDEDEAIKMNNERKDIIEREKIKIAARQEAKTQTDALKETGRAAVDLASIFKNMGQTIQKTTNNQIPPTTKPTGSSSVVPPTDGVTISTQPATAYGKNTNPPILADAKIKQTVQSANGVTSTTPVPNDSAA